ncbi:MAG: cytochrome c556 [Paracoccaceae bacterium]|jgi:cytochrome c556
MNRIRFAVAAGALALSAIATFAHGAEPVEPVNPSDPVSVREHMMKNVGAAMGMAGKMAKGEAAYSADTAVAAFRIMNAAALGFGSQFPAGSGTDASEASPKIWTDAAGFDAAVVKFIKDTEAAVIAAPATLDAFKPVFGQVAGNCKSCHEGYRIKKN